jgi:hypothetical protein
MIKVAVIGAGAFGREHARVYSELKVHTLPQSVISTNRAGVKSQKDAAPTTLTTTTSLSDVDAASLTVPTESHATIPVIFYPRESVLESRSRAASMRPIRLSKLHVVAEQCCKVGHLETL